MANESKFFIFIVFLLLKEISRGSFFSLSTNNNLIFISDVSREEKHELMFEEGVDTSRV